MYWQVYLHKTVLAAEWMMMGVLERARDLVRSGVDVWTTPAVRPFLEQDLDRARFMADPEVLAAFCAMDDNDVMCCIKAWQSHSDFVLSDLSRRISQPPPLQNRVAGRSVQPGRHRRAHCRRAGGAFPRQRRRPPTSSCMTASTTAPTSTASHGIQMLFKDGSVRDVASASDHLNLSALSVPVERHFLAYPQGIAAPSGRRCQRVISSPEGS